MKNDAYGDRMKVYEKASETFLSLDKPIVIRIDGKRFSKFTRKMEKPFDVRMRDCMQNTTLSLAKELGANIAYTQSDEITLVFTPDSKGKVNIIFDGRVQKLTSVIASMATTFFIRNYDKHFFDNALPKFDCRAFNVPTINEAANAVYWRIVDSNKNSISCIYRYTFGHKKMQNKKRNEMYDELLKAGVDFKNIYHEYITSGTLYYKKFMNLMNDEGIEYTRGYHHMMSGDSFPKRNKEATEFLQSTIRNE